MAAIGIFWYAHKAKAIDIHPVEKRMVKQATVRLILTPAFALLGMLFAFLNLTLALILFAFPVIFNIIPGSLDFMEKLFRFRIE